MRVVNRITNDRLIRQWLTRYYINTVYGPYVIIGINYAPLYEYIDYEWIMNVYLYDWFCCLRLKKRQKYSKFLDFILIAVFLFWNNCLPFSHSIVAKFTSKLLRCDNFIISKLNSLRVDNSQIFSFWMKTQFSVMNTEFLGASGQVFSRFFGKYFTNV